MSSRSYTLNSLSSHEKVLASLSKRNAKRIRENIDFSSFSNFVYFGSALYEVNYAINEILDFYPSFEKWGVSATNLVVTADDSFVAEYLGWKYDSDPFSVYLANRIATTSITATITGATYASSSAQSYSFVIPFLHRQYLNQWYFSSDAVVSEVNSWIASATDYDVYNLGKLTDFLPDVMTQQDDEFDTLIKAIAKQFDDLYITMKDIKNLYAMEYQFDNLPNDFILNQFIDSLGFRRVYDLTEKNLIDYYQAVHGTTYSGVDISRYFKAAFVNNISGIIKSKGTRKAVRMLGNIFGWPENLIQINEYITISKDAPSSGFTYHNWTYQPVNIPVKTLYGGSQKFQAAPSEPNFIVTHFTFPDFYKLRNGTIDSNIDGMEIITLVYDGGGVENKAYINYSSSAIGMMGTPMAFPATDSTFDYVTTDTIFTLSYDLKVGVAYLSYYSPIINHKIEDSSTAKSIGTIYSLSANVGTSASPIATWYNLIIDYHGNEWLNTLGVKIYVNSNPVTIASLSSLIMDYQTLKWNSNNPYGYWEIPSIPQYGEAITHYVDKIGKENAIAAISPSSAELKTIYVLKAQEMKFSAGVAIDPIGIYVDKDGNVSNYLRSNNRLEIICSPTKIINDFIQNLLTNYNIDDLYGKASDLYEPNYSKLTTLMDTINAFLSAYSSYFDFQTFYKVLKTQYPENIIKMIIEFLVPAKSDVEGGILVENDMLYDKKYAWKKPQCSDEELQHSIYQEKTSNSLIVDESVIFKEILKNQASEQSESSEEVVVSVLESLYNIYESNKIQNIQNSAVNQLDNVDCNHVIQKTSSAVTISECTIASPSNNLSLSSYENRYLISSSWGLNDYQGNETSVNSITGLFKFGETLTNSNWIIENAYEEKIAHSEISQLNMSWNKTEMKNNDEYGTLNLSLTRYGNQSPNAKIKLIIPSRTESDLEPIIVFSNVYSASGDIGYPSLSTATELTIKLGSDGFRHLNYSLNVPEIASSAISNASTIVNFGNLGPSATPITMPVIGNNAFLGDAGNLLSFIIEEDQNMHSSYAKCEIIKNKIIKLSVIEVPYVVYNIIDALTSNSNINNFVTLDLSSLYLARDNSTSDLDWMSKTVGEFKLQNGLGEMSTIKNKDYDIQALNIYNYEKKQFRITPRVDSIAIDENQPIKETT